MMTRLKLEAVFLFLLSVGSQAYAGVTLLLEEPYSYDGTYGGTGHAAVYLSRICAESPIILRRCAPGNSVLSSAVTMALQGTIGSRFRSSLICTRSTKRRMFLCLRIPSSSTFSEINIGVIILKPLRRTVRRAKPQPPAGRNLSGLDTANYLRFSVGHY